MVDKYELLDADIVSYKWNRKQDIPLGQWLWLIHIVQGNCVLIIVTNYKEQSTERVARTFVNVNNDMRGYQFPYKIDEARLLPFRAFISAAWEFLQIMFSKVRPQYFKQLLRYATCWGWVE